jgi:ribonuclease G
LPFQWFRRKREERTEQAPQPAAAPHPEQTYVTPAEPAPAGVESTEQKPKRRRGSRGGRSRKKTGTTTTATATATREKPKPTAAKAKAEPPKKEQSQRRERRASSRTQTRRRAAPRRAPLPAAKRELVVSVDVGEQRVAVLEDERVAEVYLERPERRSIAGNIYLGVVDNVLPGMEAAFVEIGLEKNGFLYVDEIVRPELEGKGQGRRIQDLIKRGERVLVQAVKDPMKSKGARLTTEISLPGRFVVFVPVGEGLGVSRRLEEDERVRLRDIVKALKVKDGGVIVRTAAEGASAEDVQRDLVFLQKLWQRIQEHAKDSDAPALVYQEAELPLRVTRDLFTGDFERARIDDERTFKRVVGYLKKTSPHMVERVERYKDKTPLFEAAGVEDEINSTLSRRVDLPSGGYLVFDYAEAFTVIDVNTGRFVGGRGKNSAGRLEDTITKNNLEAVKEVVRQLRLRDIGGIIVIDFIDMANPANRATVEEALRAELERDRTKTYVVEISPLGLVEMTRQNVTDGPREILTKKCPTCGGDGIVVSETTAAVELERRLRELAAAKPRTKAFRVEIAAMPGMLLIGAGATRLEQIESSTKRRFLLELVPDVHLDHFRVLEEGPLEKLQPAAPVTEETETEVKLVEVGLHDPTSAVAKLDGIDVHVAGASGLVGKKVRVRIARVLDGLAFAALVDVGAPEPPITAEGEAEKPTRTARAKKTTPAPAPKKKAAKPKPAKAKPTEEETEEEEEEAAGEAVAAVEDGAAQPAKKKTRRGTRGGRRRRKPAAQPAVRAGGPGDGVSGEPGGSLAPEGIGSGDAAPKIHLPDRSLEPERAAEAAAAPAAEPEVADEPDAVEGPAAEAAAATEGTPRPKKKTRRGSRGGRRRRKPAAGAQPASVADGDGTTESAA